MTKPANYTLITQGLLTKLVQRCSPYHKEGKWLMGEYALAGTVVAGGLMELVHQQLRADKDGVLYAVRMAKIDPLRSWASRLGFAPDTITVILRDMDIEVAA